MLNNSEQAIIEIKKLLYNYPENTEEYPFTVPKIDYNRNSDYQQGVIAGEGDVVEMIRNILRRNQI